MSIKSIVCICDGTPGEISSLNSSLALAKAQAAQLRILHITSTLTPYVEGIVANSTISAAIEDENAERLRMAREFSAHYAALHHVPLDTTDAPARHASARFVHRSGQEDSVISEEGRVSDLIVVGRSMSGRNIVYDNVLVAALFNTARPVLIVPSFHGPLPREWEHKIVALPWNGSLEAARAIFNAMPLLEAAEKVHILMAHSHKEAGRVTEEGRVMDYLTAHGIPAEIIMIDRGHRSAGEALLAKAHELKADLMVMGAYGHTRAREMIMGGVTHHMITHADIPLLLSH